MASVTGRIQQVKQPRGGYIKPSSFEKIQLEDGVTLHEEENIHGIIVGLAVDYLTRFIMGTPLCEAFRISLLGAQNAEGILEKNTEKVAKKLLNAISGIDEKSIIKACKLVAFDAWARNPMGAALAKSYKEISPDKMTVENIQTLVKRSVVFFETYGPIVQDGFTFGPATPDLVALKRFAETQKGTYGGYTEVVSSGDGDFLTADTLWDFKVSKSAPKSKHTLQLLMYWIMGQHSGQPIFKEIKNLGIFNPRLNAVYLLNTATISPDIIKTVEKEVICY